jgi:hypothetical protein
MRPLSVFFLAFLLWAGRALGQAGTTAAIDAEYGFNGVQLGIPASALKGVSLVEDVGRWLTYHDTRSKIPYAGFELTDVTYNFFWGKLYSIHVEIHDKRNVRGILKLLEQNYGREYTLESRVIAEADTTLETREWKGKRVYLLYKSGKNGKGAQLVLVDRPTWDKLQEPRAQEVQKNREWMKDSFMNGDFDVRPDKP